MLTQRPDPETALRIACERMLLANAGPNRGSVPSESASTLASALVLLAGLDRQAADAAVDDYATAMSLRGVGVPPHFRAMQRQHAQQQGAAPALELPAVCAVGREVLVGEDRTHVASVVLGSAHAQVVVDYHHEPAHFARRHASMMAGTPSPPSTLIVADDTGRSVAAHFSGGGGGNEWHGRWTTDAPLSASTSWLELDGTRLELEHAMPSCSTRVEERDVTRPVQDYLWDRLADGDHIKRLPSDPLLDLLAEVGLLTEDDEPFLQAYAEVGEALGQWRRPAKLRSREVPDRWRSCLSRRSGGGRALIVPMAARTPAFDGYQAVVSNLRGHADGFAVDVLVHGPRGGAAVTSPFEDEVCTNPLTWWAEDDRGNSYLAQWDGHGSSPDHAEGQLQFRPGLDPRASVLRLTPQTLTHRAVIEVPLP